MQGGYRGGACLTMYYDNECEERGLDANNVGIVIPGWYPMIDDVPIFRAYKIWDASEKIDNGHGCSEGDGPPA